MAIAGVLVSGYLLISAVRGASPVCLVGSCEEVASSSFARLLGLPISAWGFALYLVAAAVASAGVRARPVATRLPEAFFGLVVFGAAFSAYLVWLQLGVIRAVCAWCALNATLWVALLVVSLWIARRHG